MNTARLRLQEKVPLEATASDSALKTSVVSSAAALRIKAIPHMRWKPGGMGRSKPTGQSRTGTASGTDLVRG